MGMGADREWDILPRRRRSHLRPLTTPAHHPSAVRQTGPRPLWTVREYDPVTPGALGLVQRLVGPLEQRLETLVRTAQGHAQAHRDRHRHAVLERMPLDRPAQVLG